ncbi:MAG: NAD-dependent epimerase/dehydratase family protein [Acidobacteria bacterium]|nr:NAD-dependent epimerase/dehydratase family protein [Acidobacteriota bacterium]
MAIFLTGSTGFVGSHIAAGLLDRSSEPLNLLVRARDDHDAELRLWRSFQAHFDFPRFHNHLRSRITIFRGSLTDKYFGLAPEMYRYLVESTGSVIHCAASLNRKSEKACLNTNLRGTLEVAQLSARAHAHHGLRRFSHVSTVAVAGVRSNEMVQEDRAVEWDRNDYDPYARTKKFCEHMVRELLPEVSRTIFRPSIVLGNSRHGETTQFDMARAFVILAGLRVLPFQPTARLDIVPVDFVADSVVAIHLMERPRHEIYHLSSGAGSLNFRQITDHLARARHRRPPLYLPWLQQPFSGTIHALTHLGGGIGFGATLLKVFLPYLVWNTVFDNSRVVEETGRTPEPFTNYCLPLLQFSREHHFTYPYRDWPGSTQTPAPGSHLAGASPR